MVQYYAYHFMQTNTVLKENPNNKDTVELCYALTNAFVLSTITTQVVHQ